MIGLLRPYPAMKDSAVRWLGAIPESWDIVRSKRLFIPRTELARADDIQLSATQAYGVIPQADYERAVGRKVTRILQHLEKRRHVEVDDFVISMRSFQGGLERAWASGCIRSSYVVLRPAAPLVVGYYAYLFKSNGYIRVLQSTASFIRDGQDLNFENFSEVDLPLPPIRDQSAIARFLEHADRRIRRYIRTKQKQIRLLGEQKYAIVDRVVTRGLNPHVSLKPSGLEWLGDVPEAWDVVRLKTLVSQVTSGSRGWSNFAADTGALFIRIGNLTRSSVDLVLDDVIRLRLPAEALAEGRRTRVQPNDILLSITAYIGSVAVVPTDIGEAYVSQHVACCRPTPGAANPRWVAYVLLSSVGQAHGQLSMYGGTKQGLSLDDVKNYVVLLPPLEDQSRLVTWIEETCSSVDRSIDNTRREIDLLREYRTRLIADVVTGKVDVREAAEALPDEVEESNLLEHDGEPDSDEVEELPDTVPAEAEA